MVALIIVYIISIFFNRWLNKIFYKIDYDKDDIVPSIWFIPFFGTIWLIIVVLSEYKSKNNWFTGKNW
jgi:glycerol-3-phosphate acyltransferase PlsY